MQISDLIPRMQNKITQDPETGCWVWTGARDRYGYGRMYWEGGAKFTHRIAYLLLKGDPGELSLDHLCRNPPCCNPEHLEPVTHRVNMQRGKGGPVTAARYRDHLHCPKGHPLFGPNLYVHINKSGYQNKQCKTCRLANNRARYARLKSA